MSGYFVVYIIGVRDYLVLPIQWYHDINFERIVNYLLVTSHRYRCFYSTEPRAWIDDKPNGEYEADFNAPLQDVFGFPEACHIGILVKFYGMLM